MRFTVAILALLIMTGCAHGVIQPLPPVTGAAAEITVIRPSGFVGCGVPLPVTVDGQDAYGIACGEHVVMTVSAGERIIGVKHWTWGVTDENTTAVDAAPGGRYYLRLDVSGFGGPVLNRITEQTGRALMAETARIE